MTTENNWDKYRPFNEDELLQQIGKENIFAISGGRVEVWRTDDGKEARTVTLPVSHGYKVEIYLDWDDTYTVSRILVRKGKTTVKGTIEGVYCDQVGEIAYQASCFVNVKFGSKVVA